MNGKLRSGAKSAVALFALFFSLATQAADRVESDRRGAGSARSTQSAIRHTKAAPPNSKSERRNAESAVRGVGADRRRGDYERKKSEFERKKAELARKKADLDDVHRKLGNLRQEIAVSEAARSEVADALSEVERAISASQRRLREISDERSEAEAGIAALEEQREALRQRLDKQRKDLGETLYRYYVFGRKAGARRLLGGDDLNQLARDAYYLERLADARQAEIQRARATLVEHDQLIARLQQKRHRIAALEREQASEHEHLLAEQGKRTKVLAAVQGKLRVARREVATLKQDESRLGHLIDGLARLPPPPPPPPKSVPAKTLPPPRTPLPSKPLSPVRPPAVASSRPAPQAQPGTPIRTPPREVAEQVNGHANELADASVGEQVFAALKGKLKWPARGELIGRFGAKRAEGGSQWKGVFIRAASGEVRAVAAGRVVYADWLRGFGNLIIVDHGNDYMTVYGNNEALFKTPGTRVRAGETIASVGSSGGSENSGLYFEIRYRGAPQDPARWVSGH